MTTLTIADEPDLLTAEWLTAALRAGGTLSDDVAVATVTAAPLGTGQMCDSLRLVLTYDGATSAPPTLVAKLPAADPTSRSTAVSLRSYEKEVRFYQQLAADLPVATPGVVHAAIEPATASFVLLLEDMAPATVGDQLAGTTVEVAEAAVRELVKLHAPRWGDPDLLGIEWLAGDPAASRAFLGMLLPGVWAGFKERYAEALQPHVVEVGEALMANLESYLGRGGTGPQTITHGDYRLDNLLIGADSGIRGVVDWQTVTVGPGLNDVAYFIGAGLLAEDRRPAEERLVRAYHDDLVAAGVTAYPWEQCWEDHRRGTFAGLVMAVAASMLVERTERGDRMFLAMAHRHSQHALDLDAAALL